MILSILSILSLFFFFFFFQRGDKAEQNNYGSLYGQLDAGDSTKVSPV